MRHSEIISLLPYQQPFFFVDELEYVNENGAKGYYTLKNDEFFYEGHFKDQPITPGVILTEIMAQIGVVCLGIFLIRDELDAHVDSMVALTSNAVNFYKPVFPGEKVTVVSEKILFRFHKLKCAVQLFNEKNELVCKGEISGMIKSNT